MRVRFDDITKTYAGTVALSGFDLEVPSGELLVLLGPSGSGKSTALRVLAGLEAPDAGRVHIGERDVTDVPPHRRGLAMVFQDYALYPHLDVRENLSFGMRARREPSAAITVRVGSVAELLDLGPMLDRYPDQLSGGQRQRVAVARAMVREPAVYLMDEPLASLDAQLRARTRSEIVDLHRRLGTTTVYVTHDQAEAMTMADRVAVVADGRVAQVGRPQEVYDEPASTFVAGFLGSPPMNLLPGGGILGGPPGSTVGVRAEDFALAPDGTDEGSAQGAVSATVRGVEALGSESLVTVTCGRADGGDRLVVRTEPRTTLRPGDQVALRVDASRRHVFDESGRRRTG